MMVDDGQWMIMDNNGHIENSAGHHGQQWFIAKNADQFGVMFHAGNTMRLNHLIPSPITLPWHPLKAVDFLNHGFWTWLLDKYEPIRVNTHYEFSILEIGLLLFANQTWL